MKRPFLKGREKVSAIDQEIRYCDVTWQMVIATLQEGKGRLCYSNIMIFQMSFPVDRREKQIIM